MVLSVMPSHLVRGVYAQMLPFLHDRMVFVSATKGLENEQSPTDVGGDPEELADAGVAPIGGCNLRADVRAGGRAAANLPHL